MKAIQTFERRISALPFLIFAALLVSVTARGQDRPTRQATDGEASAGADVKAYINPRQLQAFGGGGGPTNGLTAAQVGAAIQATNTTQIIPMFGSMTLLHSNNTAQVQVRTNFNIVSGSTSNAINPTFIGSTISGGGAYLGSNYIGSTDATIGGGSGNIIKDSSDGSVIAGGQQNGINTSTNLTANDEDLDSVIGGGNNNLLLGNQSVIAGGSGNTIVDVDTANISGGSGNVITNTTLVDTFNDAIGGGGANTIIDANFATIPGGHFNSVTVDGAWSIGSLLTNTEPYSVDIGYFLNAMVVHSNGNVTVAGTLSGNGSGLTNLDGSHIITHTIPISASDSTWPYITNTSQFVTGTSNVLVFVGNNGSGAAILAPTNIYAMLGIARTTNSFSGTTIDFSVPDQGPAVLAGNLTFTAVANVVAGKPNQCVIHLLPGGADRTIAFPAGVHPNRGATLVVSNAFVNGSDFIVTCHPGIETNVAQIDFP